MEPELHDLLPPEITQHPIWFWLVVAFVSAAVAGAAACLVVRWCGKRSKS